MKSTKQKPAAPGWYWYRDEVSGVVAAEVFTGSEYHGGRLIAFVPGYNYLPEVEALDGEWSDAPIKDAPPWVNEFTTEAGTDARALPNDEAHSARPAAPGCSRGSDRA